MPFIEIRVLEARGSAPRDAGTRMWVGSSGTRDSIQTRDTIETRGTIGGGNLEYTALKIAREMLLCGESRRERRFALGDALGQCCGGNVTLLFERRETIVEGESEPALQVLLFGAGHVGKELARILERLPCSLTWVDPRPDQFPTQTTAKVVIEEEPAWMVDEAGAGACYLVMTHSHALDLEIVERALRRKDYRFVGLIGSQTKAAKFRARLKGKGIDPTNLVCPIGLIKSGKHPAEVAVSIAAQLLSLLLSPSSRPSDTSDRAARALPR